MYFKKKPMKIIPNNNNSCIILFNSTTYLMQIYKKKLMMKLKIRYARKKNIAGYLFSVLAILFYKFLSIHSWIDRLLRWSPLCSQSQRNLRMQFRIDRNIHRQRHNGFVLIRECDSFAPIQHKLVVT